MADEIEFLDPVSDSGEDEYLQLAEHRGRHRAVRPGPRRHVVVAVALVTVAAGVLVARAVTADNGSTAAAPASLPTAVRTAPAPSAAVVTTDPSVGVLADLAGAQCLPSDQVGEVIRTVVVPGSAAPSWQVRSVPVYSVTFPPPTAPGPSPNQEPVSGVTVTLLPRIPGVRTAAGEVTSGAGNTVQGCFSPQPAQCPESDDGQIACQVTREVPPAVLDAVRASYPGARVTFAYTEVARQTRLVWYRLIRFSLGHGTTLALTLEQSGNDAGPSYVLENAATRELRAVHNGARLNTVIDVLAPYSQTIDPHLPAQLASDQRLSSAG